jgi:hypothetical protein
MFVGLFKMYEHALRTIVIAASGDYLTHRIVSRAEVPRATDSDRRMKEIADYIRAMKSAQSER